jgi:hypothetical protein
MKKSTSPSKQEFFDFLRRAGRFLLTAVIVLAVIAFWLIRIYWWLAMLFLGVIIFLIELMVATNTGGSVSFRPSASKPPGFKMPEGFLQNLRGDSNNDTNTDEETRSEILESTAEDFIKDLPEESRQQLEKLGVLDKIQSASRGKKLRDILTPEEMDELILVMLAVLF